MTRARCDRSDGSASLATRACLTATFLCALLVPASGALAETPVQFATVNVQAPQDDYVNGLRFSVLWGKTQRVRGVDLGFVSLSEMGTLSGFSAVLGVNMVTGQMNGGASVSFVNIHTGNDTGLNAAFVNRVNNAERGVDFGFINIADGTTMVDIGGLNISSTSTAQVGFINVTKRIKGFQFGFINMAENGFFPVFPVFNVPKNQGS